MLPVAALVSNTITKSVAWLVGERGKEGRGEKNMKNYDIIVMRLYR